MLHLRNRSTHLIALISAALLGAVSLLVSATSVHAQQDAPHQRLDIGMPAPAFNFPKPIQGLEQVSLDALKGKVIVLEAWATWCGPCIPALHHMDELRKDLHGQPIEFIGVGIDPAERIKKFLEHNEFGLTLVADPEGAYYDVFDMHSVPGTIIIDKTGRLAAITRPDKVDLDVLKRVIAGQPSGLPRDDSVGANIEWAPQIDGEGMETYASVVIAPADPRTTTGGMMFKPGSGKISGDGMYRSNMLQLAYNVPVSRIDDGLGQWKQSDPRYRIAVAAPGGDDDLARLMLARSLETKFGFQARRETRMQSVRVLRRIKDSSAQLTAYDPADPDSKPTFSASGRGTKAVAQHLENLRMWCENMTGKPVVDETGFDPACKFNWDLEWVDGPTFFDALATIGLELVEAQRPIEFVVIVPNTQETAP